MKRKIEQTCIILAAFTLGYGLFWWFGVLLVAFIWLMEATAESEYWG